MKRKLIKQGKGGFTVYLPKKWIDKKGLQGGDEIDMIEKEGSLSIGTSSSAKSKTEYNIKQTDGKHNLRVALTHLYRNGYDVILLKNISEKQIREVSSIADRMLLGFEITEKGENTCLLENISEPTEEKYDALMRRIFLIIKDTIRNLISDYSEKNLNNLSEIESQMYKVDKFIYFCRRILVKEKNDRNPVIDWELLTFLGHIEHAIYYLYKHLHDSKQTKDNEIKDLMESLLQYFELYYDAFFTKSQAKIDEIQELRNTYQYGKCFSLLENSKDPITVSYLREMFRLIQIATSPIISELVNREIEG